ncbi:MAG TPA: hypothetical protein VG387_05525 [Rhizomicrobium sp.]|jgi:hypothetical protein|nr:hypothetical protein [Rhizomicrobium sp.]
MKTTAAIILAVGLTLSGAAQAAGGHNGGGGHGGGSSAAHAGGGGHFGGHGGGHFGGHRGGHGGYGYGYGALGLGLGLGLGAYYNDYPQYDSYGPVPYDYHGDYPDDSESAPDQGGYGTPPDVPGFWYHCDSPDGYYPYVGICAHPWQAVPALPPPPPGSAD